MVRPRPSVDLGRPRALALDARTFACPRDLLDGLDPGALDWTLHADPAGRIDPEAREPVAWTTVPLEPLPAIDDDLVARYPHCRDMVGLGIAEPDGLDLRELVRGQLALTAHRPSGLLALATGVQLAPLLDALFPCDPDLALGPTWRDGVPTLRVWAPTARHVTLFLWPAGRDLTRLPRRHPMVRAEDGSWSVEGKSSWRGGRYLYLVEVFVPSLGRVAQNGVTDPYSVALTTNSMFSLLVDPADPRLTPRVWRSTPSPPLRHPVDQVSYELHVRDFSRDDTTLPADVRGTYLAFAHDGLGMRHLARLRDAGLTTVQLLPLADFTSVDESFHDEPDHADLERLPPSSPVQQELVGQSPRHFNWGYDPWHCMAPEGSYATVAAAGSGARIAEVRTMVGALHEAGLRVVLDQVYNHTAEDGQARTSVLDKIVPGYYHRFDDGVVATSSCAPNVAGEHAMAAKLMRDAVVYWARQYRVDGFRFDLMAFHPRSTMLEIRAALDRLTVEHDGVDGRAVTMCGEGWDVGEVAGNARFVQASQGQLGGTGIATFSDRLRDAVRGGEALEPDPREQGFVTGLAGAPNGAAINGGPVRQREELLHDADLIQLGLAGTLRDVAFRSQLTGAVVRGDGLRFRDRPAGYADAPDEAINYVDAHDNETLFDALALKLPPATSMGQRIRANTLALALATLGQNPVLWHAGVDILRSKSLDRDSYDSGDWFNRLDFTMLRNGFGAGLPPPGRNGERWPRLRLLLADPRLRPTPDDIALAHARALDVLRLRSSSRLFRLGDADAIRAKVGFPVSGTWAQQPGVVVLHLDDTVGARVDERWGAILAVFNANPWPVRQEAVAVGAHAWTLHPVQRAGADDLVRTARCDDGVFAVPGRTAAVFVRPRPVTSPGGVPYPDATFSP